MVAGNQVPAIWIQFFHALDIPLSFLGKPEDDVIATDPSLN